jgi:glycosyltransferase involved in cell wall biosynthesis
MPGRAAIVSPHPASEHGGVERVCADVANALTRRAWDVRIVGPDYDYSTLVDRLGGGPLSLARSSARRAAAEHPDLLITPGFLGAAPVRGARRIQMYQGTMVGHTLRGDVGVSHRQRARRLVGAGIAEALSGRGAVVVSASEAIAREVRRYYGVASDHIVPNGVDVERFRPRDQSEARRRLELDDIDRPIALFVGRMESRKGVDLLLPSCRRAGFELVVVSAGSLQGARNLGILTPDNCAWAYSAADCVLFPTRYEGCSLLVLEVLASGTPLLTTPVGWMPTFFQAFPAYRSLEISWTIDDIATRLVRLKGQDLRGLTAAAREWICAHVSIDHFAQAWGDLADQVVGDRSRLAISHG